MKKILCAYMLICSSLVFSIEAGIRLKEEAVFLEESEYAGSAHADFESAVFLKYHHYGDRISLLVSPQLLIRENRPYIGFNELLLSLFGNYGILGMGKNRVYFGEGVSQNFFFPMLPGYGVSEDFLYNVNVDVKIPFLSILAGAFFDTQNIDVYKKPGWFDSWLIIKHEGEQFTLGAGADAFFSIDEKKLDYGKLAFEAVYLFPSDITVYGQISFLLNEQAALRDTVYSLAGCSKYFSFRSFSAVSIMELLYKEKPGYAFYQNFTALDTCTVMAGIEGFGIDTLRGVVKFQFFLNEFKMHITGTSGNLLANDKKTNATLVTGVSYAFD
jgi:hypothetical protein